MRRFSPFFLHSAFALSLAGFLFLPALSSTANAQEEEPEMTFEDDEGAEDEGGGDEGMTFEEDDPDAEPDEGG